jgi:hypothetical protein
MTGSPTYTRRNGKLLLHTMDLELVETVWHARAIARVGQRPRCEVCAAHERDRVASARTAVSRIYVCHDHFMQIIGGGLSESYAARIARSNG